MKKRARKWEFTIDSSCKNHVLTQFEWVRSFEEKKLESIHCGQTLESVIILAETFHTALIVGASSLYQKRWQLKTSPEYKKFRKWERGGKRERKKWNDSHYVVHAEFPRHENVFISCRDIPRLIFAVLDKSLEKSRRLSRPRPRPNFVPLLFKFYFPPNFQCFFFNNWVRQNRLRPNSLTYLSFEKWTKGNFLINFS